MPRKNNAYSKDFKMKAIDMYVNQHFSAKNIADELRIRSKTQVQRWVKLYHEKGEAAFDEERRGKSKGPGKGRPKTNFASQEEELQYLRMENEFLKKLKALWKK